MINFKIQIQYVISFSTVESWLTFIAAKSKYLLAYWISYRYRHYDIS